MAQFPAMPLWTDAYLSDTMHLSTTESGAYLHLLMAAWRSPDCSIPDDDVALARMARLSKKQWLKMRETVLAFWTLDSQKWVQKRLLKERNRVTLISNRRSDAAKSKSLKSLTTAPANAEQLLCKNDAPITITKTISSTVENETTVENNTQPTQQQGADGVDWWSVMLEALAAAGMPERRAVNETGTGPGWRARGYNPEWIIETIKFIASKPGYQPPNSLRWFDTPIAQRHAASKVVQLHPAQSGGNGGYSAETHSGDTPTPGNLISMLYGQIPRLGAEALATAASAAGLTPDEIRSYTSEAYGKSVPHFELGKFLQAMAEDKANKGKLPPRVWYNGKLVWTVNGRPAPGYVPTRN